LIGREKKKENGYRFPEKNPGARGGREGEWPPQYNQNGRGGEGTLYCLCKRE